MHDIRSKITLPTNWLSDITLNNLTNQSTLTFYKMGHHDECYSRMVEKQLVITAGTYIFSLFHKEFLCHCHIYNIYCTDI